MTKHSKSTATQDARARVTPLPKKMIFPVVSALFALCLPQASALNIKQVPELQPEKQALIRGSDDLMAKINQAKKIAATDNTAGIILEGQANLEKTLTYKDSLANDGPLLTDLVAETDKFAKATLANSKSAENLVKMLKKNRKSWVEKARKETRHKLAEKLKSMYHELEGWKKQVLSNPYKQAEEAGKQAAEKYYKNVEHLYSRVHEYELAANAAAGESASLAGAAKGLAGTAQAEMAGGDVVNAQQNLATSQAMAQRSSDLKGQAGALHGSAKAMQDTISQYLVHAHMAAWRAMYEANPEGYPPPPTDVDTAFLPDLKA